MRGRTTQTNEPGRCAALLSVLSAISAPDDTRPIAPVLRCEASANTPLPQTAPEVVWRGGLDLNPLSVDSAEDMGWLETLVWPEQDARVSRLRSAIAVARTVGAGIVRGDLRRDLSDLAGQAPAQAKLVVFHTAVLAYVASQDDRDAFVRSCRDVGATWICNEFPYAYPQTAAKVPEPHPKGMFLLSVNGRPVAWTAPHGQTIGWL